jgi:hypothetical protein
MSPNAFDPVACGALLILLRDVDRRSHIYWARIEKNAKRAQRGGSAKKSLASLSLQTNVKN